MYGRGHEKNGRKKPKGQPWYTHRVEAMAKPTWQVAMWENIRREVKAKETAAKAAREAARAAA